jgi:serine/threonine-protein kinase RsbW
LHGFRFEVKKELSGGWGFARNEIPRLSRNIRRIALDHHFYSRRECSFLSLGVQKGNPGFRFLNLRENTVVSQGSLALRMELRSNPEMLSVVRGALTRLTERLGFPDPECRAVVRAVDEALTNIIRHAYHGQTGRPIEASFRSIQVQRGGAQKTALEIVLEDQGARVDRARLRERPLEEVRPGGLGLHFIRQSMDTVEFRHRKGKNQLRLVKFLHVPGPHKSP